MNGDVLYERRLMEQQELVQPDPIKQIKSIQSQIPKAPQEGGYTICMDFDGVLFYHETGDSIDKIGPPLLPGIQLAKRIIAAGHHLVVLTARPEHQHNTMLGALKGQGVKAYEVTNIKPPAAMYIDDRAIQWPMNFRGQKSRESRLAAIESFGLREGGVGSGDKGHGGRPGQVGGSGWGSKAASKYAKEPKESLAGGYFQNNVGHHQKFEKFKREDVEIV